MTLTMSVKGFPEVQKAFTKMMAELTLRHVQNPHKIATYRIVIAFLLIFTTVYKCLWPRLLPL